MEIDLKPGKYVAAVSGGVDSVVLLRLLRELPGAELVVAHFDHGIREDSADDRAFVQKLAKEYSLPFVYAEGRLGAGAGEAAARRARYDFLREVRREHKAQAIITAHHQDDVLETAIINLLRGTRRKGLTSLSDQPDIKRPLLAARKAEVIAFAQARHLTWREDSTNHTDKYLRNYVRHHILPRFDEKDRARLQAIIQNQQAGNQEIDTLLVKQLARNAVDDELDRQWFAGLPHAVAKEIMAAWLRASDIRGFDSKGLERLVVAGKTAKPGDTFNVVNGVNMTVGKASLALADKER